MGRITTRHQGGGHKQHYRLIDFKRDKDGIAGRVERIEYDPNRTAHIALVLYKDGERRYIIAPEGRRSRRPGSHLGQPMRRSRPGNALPLRNIPVGTQVHCVELKPGKGAQMARSAGASVQVVAREGAYATLRLRSGEMRKVHIDCRATIGEVGQRRTQPAPVRQGRCAALAGYPPDGARRGDEPRRPSARRRRRQDLRRPASGIAVGPARPRVTRPVPTSAPTA